MYLLRVYKWDICGMHNFETFRFSDFLLQYAKIYEQFTLLKEKSLVIPNHILVYCIVLLYMWNILLYYCCE